MTCKPVLGCLLALLCLPSLAQAGTLEWERSFKRAEKKAKKGLKKSRALLVLFTDKGSRDVAAKDFENDVNLKALGAYMVGAALKFKPKDKTALRFRVTKTPTAIFLSTSGRERARWEGIECDAGSIGWELDKVLRKNQQTKQEQEASARRAAQAEARKAAEVEARKKARAEAIAEKASSLAKGRELGPPALPPVETLAAEAALEKAREWYLRRQERVEGLGKPSGGEADAVRAALRWLSRHRSVDGRWETGGWSRNCRAADACPKAKHGDLMQDGGVTGLALLTFLGAGHTTRVGEHQQAVTHGLQWLLKNQKQDGSLFFWTGETSYNHAIATQVLCEAYAASGDAALKAAAEKAVRLVVDSQNPSLGWKYGRRSGRNDTSVTAWMTQALYAAKRAGLAVPDKAFEGALRWFQRATASDGDVGYETPGGGSARWHARKTAPPGPAMTAASLASRLMAGDKLSEDGVKDGFKLLYASRPAWGPDAVKANFYYWYYGAQAIAQAGQPKKSEEWRAALVKVLLDTQRAKGTCADGSWDPVGPWGPPGGRVYTTTVAALALLAPYRVDLAAWKPPEAILRARKARGAQ